jgi:hypothetical protein
MTKNLPAAGLLLTSVLVLGACAETNPRSPVEVRPASVEEAAELWELELRILMSFQARLWNVGQPLLVAGRTLCGDETRESYGFWALTRWDIGGRYHTAAIRIYDLDDSLRVVHIAPGSPAAKAGLMAGDAIEAVGPHKIPVGREANAALLRASARMAASADPVAFHIRRGGKSLVIGMESEPQCDYSLILTESEAVEAVTIASKVFVSRGMMRLAKGDAQLSAVIAHELAHGVLDHRETQVASRDAGERVGVWLSDFFVATKGTMTFVDPDESRLQQAAARPFDPRAEIEADYVGLYFLARAGLSLDGADDIWRRMAADSPPYRHTHPIDQARFSAFEQAVAKVQTTRDLGLPLLPEDPPAVTANAD